jgi:hypothetical protein
MWARRRRKSAHCGTVTGTACGSYSLIRGRAVDFWSGSSAAPSRGFTRDIRCGCVLFCRPMRTLWSPKMDRGPTRRPPIRPTGSMSAGSKESFPFEFFSVCTNLVRPTTSSMQMSSSRNPDSVHLCHANQLITRQPHRLTQQASTKSMSAAVATRLQCVMTGISVTGLISVPE